MFLIVSIIFIGLFFYLFKRQESFFQNKNKILQYELIIMLLMTVIQIILIGFGMTFVYLLIWIALGALGYYAYLKVNQKTGFLLTTFACYFTAAFLILQIFIY